MMRLPSLRGVSTNMMELVAALQQALQCEAAGGESGVPLRHVRAIKDGTAPETDVDVDVDVNANVEARNGKRERDDRTVINLETKASVDWETSVRKLSPCCYRAGAGHVAAAASVPQSNRLLPFVCLLVSPPGAGKSHLMEYEIMPECRKIGVRCGYIDGSNDALVEVALVSLLRERFPDKTAMQPGLLIVDEYHMLTGM